MGTQAVTLIAGPTASGKSALAIALAERTGAMVVNADSMQVYHDLSILTARPGATDLARAEHRLYGHIDARDAYSVARWLGDVEAVLDDARTQTRPVILVGGTGLYFRALTAGLSSVPPINDAVRTRLRAMAAEPAGDRMHALLKDRDPEMAGRLEPSDTQRITRALEVIESTGKSLLHWQRQTGTPLVGADATRVVLAPPRRWLHARIAARFETMVATGAITEARQLMALGLSPSLPAMKAIGVRELGALPDMDASLANAVERCIAQTRQYAKRQETFFRGQLGDWPRLDPNASTVRELVTQLAHHL
ncbi:tRNA (adenosine(37)-N6)-dimethylallyltransferase MiaA [Stappia sp. ES.058]|uniref:tRNA (adenosine(37)-N6)-dimethylallyltransferase MiaA n=1 Tax=Stappia sp. ES.058 TaxID=1881061 RepID=UPI00087997D4|nr:tRNA (adenosine(37)-N6)-dimethylallyltransferase MiaA [Stappia sp. ES.058]SDU26225.1 tRNA dimethylallyltransferase [Stappia sp. ES.058]